MADRKRGRARNIDESRGHQDDSLNHSNKLFNNNNQNTLSSTWNKQQQQLQSQGRNVRSKFDGNHGQSDAEVEFDIPIEKPQIPEVEKQPDTMNRNRRLFAGLMGHLDLARKRLAADSTSIDKRNQALEAAKQRNEIKSKEIAEQLQKKIFHEKQKVRYHSSLQCLKFTYQIFDNHICIDFLIDRSN